MKGNNKKGFTLAELLIVVAIIAVLVAIAIPTFSAQSEKAREGVDASNIRSTYSEVMATIIADPDTAFSSDAFAPVELKQTVSKWQNGTISKELSALAHTTSNVTVTWLASPAACNNVTSGAKVYFSYNGEGGLSIGVSGGHTTAEG